MLSLIPDPAKLRACVNFMPRGDGSIYTRPGATQILTGRIAQAVAWDHLIVFYQDGFVRVWNGAKAHYVYGTDEAGEPTYPMASGKLLQAVAMQAIPAGGDGSRESRLYIADGERALWYILRETIDDKTWFLGHTITNTVLDGEGDPYPLTVAYTVANWRNRLWTGDYTHRLYHCENNDPDAWDPLYEIQVQAQEKDQAFVLLPSGDQLIIGQEHSLWAVTGTSQYNWQLSEITRQRGIAGLNGAAQLGAEVYHAAAGGLFKLGQEESLSAALDPLFATRPARITVNADPAARLVYFTINGQMFVMHTERPGEFTQLDVIASGLVMNDRLSGWYGENGLWLFGQRWSQDTDAAGNPIQIMTQYDTWDQIPRMEGSGRSLCERTRLLLSGPFEDSAVYDVMSDEGWYTTTIAQAPVEEPVPDVPGVLAEYFPPAPVRRELTPRLPGNRFRHRIRAVSPIEIHQLQPVYR